MLVVRYATGLGDHVVVSPAMFLDSSCPHDVDMMWTVSTFLSQAVLDMSLMHIGYVAWYFLYIFLPWCGIQWDTCVNAPLQDQLV